MTVSTARMNIARQLDLLTPAELSWVASQVCFDILIRLAPGTRAAVLSHLRGSFALARVPALNGHAGGPGPPGEVQHRVHAPGADGGVDPVHAPGATLEMHSSREGGKGGGFLQFWSLYPLKKGKLPAEKKWNQLWKKKEIQEDTLPVLFAALEAQKQSEQWLRGVIPLPKTWLHQRRWLDELHAGAFVEPPRVNLDAPIAWPAPGCLLRLWNELAPGDDARGPGCPAIETVDAGLLALERAALAAHPREAWWRETFTAFAASTGRLLGRVPPERGGLAHPVTVERFLEVPRSGGRRLAARVHDGEWRDG
jgi:hypothetical protein